MHPHPQFRDGHRIQRGGTQKKNPRIDWQEWNHTILTCEKLPSYEAVKREILLCKRPLTGKETSLSSPKVQRHRVCSRRLNSVLHLSLRPGSPETSGSHFNQAPHIKIPAPMLQRPGSNLRDPPHCGLDHSSPGPGSPEP